MKILQKTESKYAIFTAETPAVAKAMARRAESAEETIF
jgi:hypothetical protein